MAPPVASVAKPTVTIFGTNGGKFFGFVPDFVDLKKAPGASVQPAATFSEWLYTALTLKHVWGSPNGVWALIALVAYFACPYDLTPTGAAYQAPLSAAYFVERFPLYAALTFGYTAFWHVTLYGLGWGTRPFIKNRPYNVDKVAHNLFWSLIAVVIWTGFDNVFAFLWATGRLPYLSDAAAFASPRGVAQFVAALLLVPAWRDAHFYAAHRLLHAPAMYRQVHSLHHRNTDIEPFAGLCMHPVEHLYYFACVAPSLVFFCTPFAFFWNGVHLLLSPGASHSGWEDHFQADQFHYLHHRYFECNFAGSNAGFLDVIFGSFVASLNHADASGAKLRPDAKSTLRLLPTPTFVAYLALAVACVAAWAVAATAPGGGAAPVPVALGLGLLAGFGPAAAAEFVSAVTRSADGANGSALFGGRSSAVAGLIQLVVGLGVCAAPVAYACFLTMRPPHAA